MAVKFWISTSSTSFNTAGNWSDGIAPANSDTLVFTGSGTASVATNLSTVLTGVTLIIEKGYTGEIGAVATGGVATPLTLDGGTLRMPRTTGSTTESGSSRIIIAFGTTAATSVIEDTANTSTEPMFPPVQVTGTVLTATVGGGGLGVGFGVRPGETATLASLRTIRNEAGSPSIFLGAGSTITDAVLEAGTVISRSDNTAVAVRIGGATYIYTGTGAHTTLNLDAGRVVYSGTGTITTANIKGEFDLSQDGRAKTITTANTYRGSILNCDNGVPGGIVFTNAINHYDGINPQTGCTLITPANVKGTLVTI